MGVEARMRLDTRAVIRRLLAGQKLGVLATRKHANPIRFS